MENEQNNINVNTEYEDEDEDEKPKKNIEENTKPRCCKICVGWFLTNINISWISIFNFFLYKTI